MNLFKISNQQVFISNWWSSFIQHQIWTVNSNAHVAMNASVPWKQRLIQQSSLKRRILCHFLWCSLQFFALLPYPLMERNVRLLAFSQGITMPQFVKDLIHLLTRGVDFLIRILRLAGAKSISGQTPSPAALPRCSALGTLTHTWREIEYASIIWTSRNTCWMAMSQGNGHKAGEAGYLTISNMFVRWFHKVKATYIGRGLD